MKTLAKVTPILKEVLGLGIDDIVAVREGVEKLHNNYSIYDSEEEQTEVSEVIREAEAHRDNLLSDYLTIKEFHSIVKEFPIMDISIWGDDFRIVENLIKNDDRVQYNDRLNETSNMAIVFGGTTRLATIPFAPKNKHVEAMVMMNMIKNGEIAIIVKEAHKDLLNALFCIWERREIFYRVKNRGIISSNIDGFDKDMRIVSSDFVMDMLRKKV